MLLTNALFSADPEFVQDVLEVLKGPANAATERAKLIARALAAIDLTEARRPH